MNLLPLFFAAACLAQPPSISTAPAVPAFRPVAEAEWPEMVDTFKSRDGLVKAAKRTLAYLEKAPAFRFKLADREYGSAVLADSAREIIRLNELSRSATDFALAVRENFEAFQSNGLDGGGRVVFSSYYQPVLQASLKKAPGYSYPLYRKPPDMIEADLGAFDKKYEGQSLIGRVSKEKKFVPYFSRDQINSHGAFAGKGYEVAWLKDKFEVLDIHIQGSGILRLPTGKEVMARFAGTNALPYNSAAMLLIKMGAFSKEEISHDKVRAYFKAHPESVDTVLSSNPRFTFFEIVPLPKDGEPFGTANQSLVPARSIAFDMSVLPLGALVFFETSTPQADKDGRLLAIAPNSRFAFVLDTGGAIKGPGRVDIYAGHGEMATTTARNTWNDGKLWVLIKKLPPRER
jgi:membrane-bound lytic murein transglycosylase A